ncbi:MFS transporter [Rathayibacter rathayi]|uniref:MFS transporter n=1 Tax=Rathayibacter rathayi TaxID=33887 RepID=A0ABD6W9V5_RATRA|nr:MFS transporter [Rathayibacter rathayi]MWV74390.1 MFS transporter [Rathayibacter rathayi NCPPB 2980 = VKM Ac-1601]PPF14849.1 MFS transporter [Rathayibacter rathayi]PPF23627.1 MFS transporter [Rathayibacter rathayi]PPF50074.1 MFS transporter [Rathayibacter rathayi]
MERVSQTPAAPRRSHVLDVAPLRESPAFARLWAGNVISGIGGQMTIVAVGLHVYELTGSTLAVALVGVVALVPTVIAGLYGGMLADAFDRRLVLLLAAIVAWGSTVGIAALAWLSAETPLSLYLLTAANAVATTVIVATRMTLAPRLLRTELVPAAAALGGIASGLEVTVGPALAGVLVASSGFALTYTIDVVLFLAAFLGIVGLPALVPEGERQRPGLESLRYGLRFLRSAPNVRMSFLVDIVAMTFGQPRVVFPAAAAVLLGGGAVTVGALTAAFAIGALLSGVFSGRLSGVRGQGVAISRSIQVYGAFVMAFGAVLLGAALTRSDPSSANTGVITLAAVALAGAGAADNVSSIFRQTMLQTAVPDNMRGRLQGVFIVVVTGGPRVGDLYTGLLASLALLWLPPLAGGLAIIAILAAVLRLRPGFRAYDALHPTA